MPTANVVFAAEFLEEFHLRLGRTQGSHSHRHDLTNTGGSGQLRREEKTT